MRLVDGISVSGAAPPRGYQPRRRPRWWLVVLIALGHVGVGLGLAVLLAPQFTAGVVERAGTQLTVFITAPEPPPPPAEPQPDAGAAGNPGREATAKPQQAAPNPLSSPSPVPRAASTGSDSQSGARDEGEGTGNQGPGSGTGSGNGGQGRGGGIASGPRVRSGELNEARDFPIPPGGRETRLGKSVTVVFTVTVEGRARDCRVVGNQVDEASAARVCPLVVERIRFTPALATDGTPVEARYGYRVDFRRRN
ncbi:MAG: hypothetical protein ABIT10_06660 [Alteraurantiacibacter sp.]